MKVCADMLPVQLLSKLIRIGLLGVLVVLVPTTFAGQLETPQRNADQDGGLANE